MTGTSVTVVATPNPGFKFVNWTEGGALVSSAAAYAFVAGASCTLTVNFVVATAGVLSIAPAALNFGISTAA